MQGEENLAHSRVGVAKARSERCLGMNRSSLGKGKVGDSEGGGICKGPEQGSFDLLYSSKESRVPHGG